MESFQHCFESFRPAAEVSTLEWAIKNAFTERGRAFDPDSYPALVAPCGPYDAFDAPGVREIALQMGSRLGKTMFGLVCLLKQAAVDPAPEMVATASKELGIDLLKRYSEMAERIKPLSKEFVHRKNRRRQNRCEFRNCRVDLAWSRSVSTLSDKNIKLGLANEIDKWEQVSTSTEADPIKLFSDRFKDLWSTRKIIWESTPSIQDLSRIESKRLSGWNAKLFVPCPRCGEYRPLSMGNGQGGGVVWEGGQNPVEARRTARYRCPVCLDCSENHERALMIRRGVWVADGCAVDASKMGPFRGLPWEAPWSTGTPLRPGEMASFQASSLYALSLDWGDIAREFVDSRRKIQLYRNFVNQWLAETWKRVERKLTWEVLGEKLRSDLPRRMVPEESFIITVGIDRQQSHWVYCIVAWLPDHGSHTLDYGNLESEEEIERLIGSEWQSKSGKRFRCAGCMIDSGYRPGKVYALANRLRKRGLQAWASKGSSRPLGSLYVRKVLGKNTSAPGQVLIFMDTASTQEWFDEVLAALPGPKTLFEDSLGNHRDYLEQILNDGAVANLDGSGSVRERWQRLNEEIPNDFRDVERNAFIAMQFVTRGRKPKPKASLKDLANRKIVYL